MRLWTLHPAHLDSKGLVALWRESLLAQKVIQGNTKGYRHHPQLLRFQRTANPEAAIATYLAVVQEEATRRGYLFDASKIPPQRHPKQLEETTGQLQYEWEHLLNKLRTRDPALFAALHSAEPRPHPMFAIRPGDIQDWEKR